MVAQWDAYYLDISQDKYSGIWTFSEVTQAKPVIHRMHMRPDYSTT